MRWAMHANRTSRYSHWFARPVIPMMKYVIMRLVLWGSWYDQLQHWWLKISLTMAPFFSPGTMPGATLPINASGSASMVAAMPQIIDDATTHLAAGPEDHNCLAHCAPV